MAHNVVHVFTKSMGKHAFVAEIRSQAESALRPASPLYVKLNNRVHGNEHGRTIHVQLPFLRDTIPVGIVFRALGITADAEILRYICYDINDNEMVEALIPSIREANEITSQVEALKFIGRTGDTVGHDSERAIAYGFF